MPAALPSRNPRTVQRDFILAVRIGPRLHRALVQEAARQEATVPEVVRYLLAEALEEDWMEGIEPHRTRADWQPETDHPDDGLPPDEDDEPPSRGRGRGRRGQEAV